MMPDREKVIKDLQDAVNDDWLWRHADYYALTMERAIALLKEQEERIKKRDESVEKAQEEIKWLRGMMKEQEAKVLTVDQLEDALDTVVWLETPVSENLADGYSLIMAYSHMYGYMYFDSPFGDNPSQDRLEYSEYGRSWRCWDRRPLEEQRKAVKWDA